MNESITKLFAEQAGLHRVFKKNVLSGSNLDISELMASTRQGSLFLGIYCKEPLASTWGRGAAEVDRARQESRDTWKRKFKSEII